ncbi:hypothetical protein L7F22_050210 [Adiantum nelumboides]|nr:hypothetical protein [Adiantum nelumboides]
MVGSATMIRAAPSATASGSQFSRLLASSRLASHSPVIPQAYTAPAAHIARGDFGLKRSLPSRNKPIGSLRYVDVEALDTSEGQTIWTECEHKVLLKKRFAEMNVRISPLQSTNSITRQHDRSYAGVLGPRISTTFDPSTRRSVPSAYNALSNENMRTHLQSEAMQGTGPIYRKNIHAGNAMSVGLDLDGPFGDRASEYSVKIPVPVVFRGMDEKRFEKYLDYIRSQRSNYRKSTSLSAAEKERQDLAARYNKERQKVQNANRVMAESSSSSATLTESEPLTEPEPLNPAMLALPEITGEYEYTSKNDHASVGIDLWNESRTVNHVTGSLWQNWLRDRDSLRASQAVNTALPSNPAPSSPKIRNQPMHPSAGVQYGSPDRIQTKLLADGVPARLLSKHNEPRSRGFVRAQDGKLNRSASAASIVAQKAVEAVESESYQDSLRESTLSNQFGQLHMTIRPVDQNPNTLSRGQPGSPRWVGEVDQALGYRSGVSEVAPTLLGDVGQSTEFSDWMRQSSETEQKRRYPSAKGTGKKMFSRREARTETLLRRESEVRKLKSERTKSKATSEESRQKLKEMFK